MRAKGDLKTSKGLYPEVDNTTKIGKADHRYNEAHITTVYGKVVGVSAATTKVVGAAASGHTAGMCDFLCDGTADQVEIQAAINVLPASGGKVVLLEGTYNISGSINVNKPNVTIEGMGNGTVLKRMFNDGGVWNEKGMIYIQGAQIKNCAVKNMRFDGNHSVYTNDINGAVKVSYSAADITVTGVTVENEGYGIVYSGNASGGQIAYNTIRSSAMNGIEIGNAHKLIVCGNSIIDSNINGIMFEWGSSYNKIANNLIIRGDGTSGDYSATQYSIRLNSANNNDISDNYIPGKNYTNGGGSTNTFDNNRYQ